MNEAPTTWALIVGIDVYDDPGIPALQGAVADALAAYQWLRDLGVPDKQILLNASPSPAVKAALDVIRPGCPPARSMDIDNSLVELEQVVGGTRLFLFLCGHGLYEPTSERLFLAQEFTQRRPANLGIELYVPRLLEMPFARQFLFMDGCQNQPYSQTERQKIAGVMYGGRTGFAPKPGNGLVACFGAGQGQRALEIGGRGLFLRYLLEGLDVDRPWEGAVDLDFETGARTVDLRKLVQQYVLPKVERDARAQTPPLDQTPNFKDFGPTSASYPVVRLPEVPTAVVEVRVTPAGAEREVEKVRVVVDEPLWFRQMPRLDEPVTLPMVNRLPVGLQGTISCNIRQGSPWTLESPTRQDFEAFEDLTLTFRLLGDLVRGSEPEAEIRGSFATKSGDYPTLAMAELTKGAVSSPEPNLRIELAPGGAKSLAGFLADFPLVWVGLPGQEPREPIWRRNAGLGRGVSLADLELNPEMTIEPGPVHVWVDLPWGKWTSVVSVPDVGKASVRLPSEVGTPPLRVALWREAGRRETLLLGTGGAAPLARFRRVFAGEMGPVLERVKPGTAAWALRIPQEPDINPSQALVDFNLEDGHRALFPLMEDQVLAVDLSRGGLRIEALSEVPSPEWDLLVANGRLDALDLGEAVELTRGNGEDWLLGLAGAYAVYAQASGHQSACLDEVLENLTLLAKRGAARGQAAPDLDLLWVALSFPGSESLSQDAAERLALWAEKGSIPVLRWGVPLAIQVLRRVQEQRKVLIQWCESLVAIEPRLSPISVWTAWTEPP